MFGNKDWKLTPPSPLIHPLARDTGLTPLQTGLLVNRGICDPAGVEAFLQPRLANLPNPLQMKGMQEAVRVIIDAVECGERITIYGDYDADGITATALLFNFFSNLGIPAFFYIPDRLKEGYGLNPDAVKRIASYGPGLILTVDCGVSNSEEIALAKRLGIKTVVTDHHQPPRDFQANCPVIDPHQPGCSFPCKDLAGVGVAFFLAVAIRAALRKQGWFETIQEPDLKQYLDLVALGTVADCVPLLGENRVMVYKGLKNMFGSRWPGIRAMMEVARMESSAVRADDLAFRLAPRLNAPGRMGDVKSGIRMLTVQRLERARELCAALEAANQERQRIEGQILKQIDRMIGSLESISDRKILVFAGENWHQGVLGVVASRLVEKYHRPSLVLSVQEGLAVGSGRSIDGFDLYHALSRADHILEKFGGHTLAAGFRLKYQNLSSLRKELEDLARRTLSDEALVPTIHIDAELPLDRVTPDAILQMEALAPFGEGNPEPKFLVRSAEVLDSRIIGDRHLKLTVRQGRGRLEAIGFGMGETVPLRGKIVNMVFTPELNRWKGYEKVQLRIVDLRA